MPGPYLRQNRGAPYTTNRIEYHFAQARASIPEIAEMTLHGLNAIRVIELRQSGLQIQDQVGMSPQMIQRYCRFMDRKADGKGSRAELGSCPRRQRKEQNGTPQAGRIVEHCKTAARKGPLFLSKSNCARKPAVYHRL
jgi:hypothetical protein